LLLLAASTTGCLDRTLKPLNPCLVEGVNAEVSIEKIDKVDLLFMVDDSQSMKEEQQALSQQFKNMITVLTTGKREGKPDFTPAKSLHLAVVSSDLGLPGIGDVKHCMGVGDDGVMQNEGKLAGCSPSYPRFLSFDAKLSSPEQTANDFACIAGLGTDGCGFEQQLESPLKALWPSIDPLSLDGTNRVRFVGDVDGSHQLGHGDTDNAGFLRTDPAEGLSLLAVVLVTDEEDCSVPDPIVLAPANVLDKNDPFQAQLASEGLNVRCALHPDKLYKTARYVDTLKALRPGHEDLVVFAAIVGVPPETVSESVLAMTDFKKEDSRARFYKGILDHPAMQPMIDDNGTPSDPLDDVVRPSCNTNNGVADPPRRIVEVAQGFGANGIVQSICQSDFTPAINAIVDLISVHITAVCLPRQLTRNKQGVVDCDVMWQLPTPGQGSSNAPTSCNDPAFPFLLPPRADQEADDGHGHPRCRVAQLAVEGSGDDQHSVPTEADGVMFQDGWFYDTFTPELHDDCDPVHQPQRVAFSKAASPPNGVTVKLECVDETQHLAQRRVDLAEGRQPAIGDSCEDVERAGQRVSGDAACSLTLASGQPDTHMFCHPDHQVCVLGCATTADCPPAWVCDQRQETLAVTGSRAFCVNPTCGDLK
jgi:hypothetical protein